MYVHLLGAEAVCQVIKSDEGVSNMWVPPLLAPSSMCVHLSPKNRKSRRFTVWLEGLGMCSNSHLINIVYNFVPRRLLNIHVKDARVPYLLCETRGHHFLFLPCGTQVSV